MSAKTGQAGKGQDQMRETNQSEHKREGRVGRHSPKAAADGKSERPAKDKGNGRVDKPTRQPVREEEETEGEYTRH